MQPLYEIQYLKTKSVFMIFFPFFFLIIYFSCGCPFESFNDIFPKKKKKSYLETNNRTCSFLDVFPTKISYQTSEI